MKYNGENYMNIRFLSQIVLQVTGLIYATVKYRNKNIEHIDDYVSGIKYSLPFDGEWYTANGGVTKDTSHSCEILPQQLLLLRKKYTCSCGRYRCFNKKQLP